MNGISDHLTPRIILILFFVMVAACLIVATIGYPCTRPKSDFYRARKGITNRLLCWFWLFVEDPLWFLYLINPHKPPSCISKDHRKLDKWVYVLWFIIIISGVCSLILLNFPLLFVIGIGFIFILGMFRLFLFVRDEDSHIYKK